METKEYNSAVYEFSDGLYRFALKLCKNQDAAKDFVQEAFEKVWIKKETIDAKKVKAYLFRTVYNSFIDTTRKVKTFTLEEHHEKAYHQSTPDLNEILHNALNQLPEAQKSAVLLRDYEGYNYAEIGEILNLTESQVKVYIFRARKQLQAIIGKIETVI